jgi:DNA-binding MarR family transcriptional regulator
VSSGGLEAAGYVTRTVDARDARRAGLTLTTAGRTVNPTASRHFRGRAPGGCWSRFEPAERAAAEHVLARLGTELRAVSDGTI